MGSLQFIATFVKIGFQFLTIKRIDLMLEEYSVRDNQGNFPVSLFNTLFKRRIAQA